MAEATLRPKARVDLEGIWDYTVETWGYEHAETYLRKLAETFDTLAENADLGRNYDEVHDGLRVHPSGRHLGFFFRTVDGVDVVRVLHERMDIRSHL